MNLSVFKNINQFAKKWAALDATAIFCARIIPFLMIIFLFFYCIYIYDIYVFSYAIISGLSARFVINEIVYLFYKRERPAHLGQTKILIPVPKNLSFPSGHASFLFGISFYLFFYSLPLAIIFVICSSLVGIARVFCGVHWFRDILGGATAGFISAITINYLLNCI